MNNLITFLLALLAGGVVWGLISLLWPRTVVGQLVNSEQDRGLLVNIEGLRGFLAFGVFLHHAIITRGSLLTGHWQAPTLHAANLLGEGGVGLFFIITAFLFWGKMLRGGGRVDLRRFYKGRLLRLAPLYLAISAVVIGASLIASPTLVGEGRAAATAAIRWLGLGLLGMPDIAGVQSQRYVASVFWSLQYEWGFYLVLPIIALGLRWPLGRRLAPFALLALYPLTLLHPTGVPSLLLLFVGGMLAAHLWTDQRFRDWRPRPLLLQGGMLLVLALLLLFGTAYHPAPAFLLLLLFLTILKLPGHSFAGGAVQSFAARALGTVSYSLYMVHGLVLYAVSQVFGPSVVASPVSFFLFVLLCGVVAVTLSMLTFRTLEHPFFRKGRRSVRATLGLRRPSAVPR